MNGWRADVLMDARLLAYRRGGIARYISELARWLPRVAPDLRVAYFANRSSSLNRAAVTRVVTPPHHRLERLALGLELTMRRPRLVHSPDFIAPLVLGSRRVITVHDLAFLTHPDELDAQSRRYYGQIHQSLQAADRVIAVSNYTASELTSRTTVDPSTIVVIPNGVDATAPALELDEATLMIRSIVAPSISEQILSGRPVLLTVGTVEPRKRHELILAAFAQLEMVMTGSPPLLVIAGQRGWNCGDIARAIEQAAAGGNVVWLETVDDRLLSALYRAATVCLVASHDEGFGLPMLEAMQAEAPVIAAAKGALPEVAGDAAVLVPGDEPHEWAEAIARLLSDRKCQSLLRERGRQRASSFSWEQTARQTAGVFREVMSW